MHEMSLCENVLQIIEQQATVQKFKKVTKVWLEIGELSGVEIDAMRFCFDAVMQSSIAAKANLEIINIEGQAWCQQCRQNVAIQQRYDECPKCGNVPLQVNNGEQMRIKELEVI